MFTSNNRASFHLWGKENFVKHQNIMKMIVYKLYTKNVEIKQWIILSMVLSVMMKKLLRMSISLFIGIKWTDFQKCKNQISLNRCSIAVDSCIQKIFLRRI